MSLRNAGARVIRVLVAEDSAVTREYLSSVLAADPGLEVVAAVRDGVEAVAEAERLRPDVVLMDVHMPRLNGYEATRRIMERVPTPIVMISASLSRDEVRMSFDALNAGALTLVEKPAGLDQPDQVESTRRLIEMVRLMAAVRVVRRWPRREQPLMAPPAPVTTVRRVRLVAIGASTGGPAAIAAILRGLPQALPVPVLVVQHIAPGFMPGFVDWLSRGTALSVKLAEPDEVLGNGTVYVAGDGLEMSVTRNGRLRLTAPAAPDPFSPSVSNLFRSLLEVYGAETLAVLLTGMGRDGAEELRALRDAGAVTVAQDEESSVIFGMPGEAIRLGAAQHVLAPAGIAQLIRTLVAAR